MKNRIFQALFRIRYRKFAEIQHGAVVSPARNLRSAEKLGIRYDQD